MEGTRRPVGWAEPAPFFEARTAFNPRFVFSSLGGRFVGLVFLGQGRHPLVGRFLDAVARASLPDDDAMCVRFAVVRDEVAPNDPLIASAFPRQRVFHDRDGDIARAYGLGECEEPAWFVVDPALRIYASGRFDRPDTFIASLRQLPDPDRHAGNADPLWAPVLLVPRVLDAGTCSDLVDLHQRGQPVASGFMRSENGKTVAKLDPTFKRRTDVPIDDIRLRDVLKASIRSRLLPEIRKAFQFTATRIERYIVACYDGNEGGFFRPHRDNTTAGTAHRRFAVTINLNAESYEGGELRFPEYGTRRYSAPTGGAIVFSCSLLHEPLPVTRGIRYATLPFLYDDEGARIREANGVFLADASPGDGS